MLVNGPMVNRNQPLLNPSTPLPVNGQRLNDRNQALVQPAAPVLVNGQAVNNGNRPDLFSHRLKQLAAITNTSSNPVTVPRIINTVNQCFVCLSSRFQSTFFQSCWDVSWFKPVLSRGLSVTSRTQHSAFNEA